MGSHVSQTRLRQLFTRRCVACGGDVTFLDISMPDQCEHCGCDFLERPPRSYAEMEGLIGNPLPTIDETVDADTRDATRPTRLIERWLLFVFLTLMMIVAIAVLASAVVTPH